MIIPRPKNLNVRRKKNKNLIDKNSKLTFLFLIHYIYIWFLDFNLILFIYFIKIQVYRSYLAKEKEIIP